jgi:catechol 2,3-dioxygenase-like lactoylglutathione lyase family enzyme
MKVICGMQQIGVGVTNLEEAFRWYRHVFGMDILIFEDDGVAALMKAYTGGEPHERHALLITNLQGGCGLEIWQFRNRAPQPAPFEIQLGDLGIYVVKIKAYDIRRCFSAFKDRGVQVLGDPLADPAKDPHFFVKDPFGAIFQIVKGREWFTKGKHITGGVSGCMIGVSDIENARIVYSDILGYDAVVYDESGIFDDLAALPGGDMRVRRVLLGHSAKRVGGFSLVTGPSQIELIQTLDRRPKKIFENRYWGDLGYIHLCFDIRHIEAFREECRKKGFPFTVDSSESMDRFDMGGTSSQFSYIEDPDGTLIEFVEPHRIPIIPKLGWNINLNKRKAEKSLPAWMLKLLRFKRIKG